MEADYSPGNTNARRIVISGCSGGGKSTLLAALAQRGHVVFPEPGRQIVKEQMFVGGPALPWADLDRFIEACVSRATYFYNSTSVAPDGVAFFDRSFIDAISAWEARHGPRPDFQETVRLYRYAQPVFLVPPWRELFANDRERQHSFETALAEYERLLRDYARFGYEVEIIPRDAIHARVDFVEQCLSADKAGGA